MMQERDERLQALQQLRRNLDPFQESHQAERLRAFGLYNLYLQMVDPSPEFVEVVVNGLTREPFGNLRQLRSDTYSAEYAPRQFFTAQGIGINDPEKLMAGIGNTGELLDRITRRYDSETGELSWGETSDPKAIAEATYEGIQIDKGSRQVRKAVEQVRNQPNVERRYRMGLNLRKQVLDYIGRYSFTFYRFYTSEDPLEPTWENLKDHDFAERLDTKDSSRGGNLGIKDAVSVAQAAILRYPFEKRLERLPLKDKEYFDQLRLQFGAKAANLIILSGLVGEINRVRRNPYRLELAVPDFQAVPVDSYRAWREGKLLDSELYPYFEWASGLKNDDRWRSDKQRSSDYIVRSSAVFSEDGENATGAGIYESERVFGGSTFEDFKEAVTKVYASTNSPQAQAYRTQHGIGKEEMGLLIQKYISGGDYHIDGRGYINSRLRRIPQLMEIVTERSRNFIKREALDFFIAMDTRTTGDAFWTAHHFPPDINRVNPELLIKVAQLEFVVERIWGRDVQVEFVTHGSTVNFVQVRELSFETEALKSEVQFPDETPIHSGASIGVGDMELPILNNEDDNSEKAGIVMFVGNYGFSFKHETWQLPKEGAVIIYNNDGQNGHIQTLCAERGLICIFPDLNKDQRDDFRYRDISELKKIRVVSNGIEARLYQG